MSEPGDVSSRRPQIDVSRSHRQRIVALDSSDRPSSDVNRKPQAIPLPGITDVRSNTNNNYGRPSTYGRTLGMGHQRRLPDQSRYSKSSVGAGHDAQGMDVQTLAGRAAIQRSYTTKQREEQRQSRRRPSDAGFQTTPRFRAPLTPHTHDNRTGKGRVEPSSQSTPSQWLPLPLLTCIGRSHNPLSPYEQDESSVVHVESAFGKPVSPTPGQSSRSSNKRQKLNNARRKIKINDDNGSSDLEQESHTGSRNVHSIQAQDEPIEIESDEEGTMVPSPDVHRRKVIDKADRGEAERTDANQLIYMPPIPKKPKPPRIAQVDHSSEQLVYPSSEDEEEKFEQRRSRNDLLKHDTTTGNVRSALQKSPYFAANNARGSADTRSEFATTGEIYEPGSAIAKSMSNDLSFQDNSMRTSQHATYKFFIRATGSKVQTFRPGWTMLVGEDGIRMFDNDAIERLGGRIVTDNIATWVFCKKIGVLNIFLKQDVSFFGHMRSVFVTLRDDERNRFDAMLSKWRQSHPLFPSLKPNDVERDQACNEAYTILEHSKGSFGRHRDQKSPEIVDFMDRSPGDPHKRKTSDEIDLALQQSNNRSNAITNSREIYERAVPDGRRPKPIALPIGRDRQTPRDERHMMVDTREVGQMTGATSHAPSSPEIDPFVKPQRTTRAAVRSAEQKASRDARTTEPLLVYPQLKGQTSVTLYEEDLDRLAPNEFLNDSIVEFYLRFNYDNLRADQREQAHVFNTFFYQRLTTSKDKDANFEAVKKWTSKGKGVDIFTKNFLVIPINENLHWYLAVVVNLNKVVFGADVTRAPEQSFIDAVEDMDGDTAEPFDTSNILGDILDDDSPTLQPQALVPASAPLVDHQIRVTLEQDDPPSVISQTPSVEAVSSKTTGQEDVYEFCDESVRTDSSRLSLTERIRGEELAKVPKTKRKTRPSASESQAMEDLTLEDSVIECSGGTSQTYGRASRKGKGRRSGPGFSKAGKHIAADVPTIIILDSLNNNHNRVYDVIKDYLVREAQDKKNEVLSSKQFATCKADLPRQDNFSDCGLFLIQYAQTLLSQPDVVPQLLNRTKFQTQTAAEAHRRAFKNMFEIDRIPLRREEMIQQIKALSIPFRKQAKLDDEQRKHERAVAKLQREAEGKQTYDAAEAEADSSCAMLPSVSKEESKVEAEKSSPAVIRSVTSSKIPHEDSIDDLNCL